MELSDHGVREGHPGNSGPAFTAATTSVWIDADRQGQKTSVVNLDFLQSGKGLQLDLLPSWRSRIELARDPRCEVTRLIEFPITWKH